MATLPPGQTLRRGLPRRPGGEPWPPAPAAAPADSTAEAPVAAALVAEPVEASHTAAPAAASTAAEASVAEPVEASQTAAPVPTARAAAAAPVADPVEASPAPAARPLRRGLPRVLGGEPWPAAGITAAAVAASTAPTPASPAAPAPVAEPVEASPAEAAQPEPAAAPAVAAATEASVDAPAGSLRRGLPRVAGGDPWPPASAVPAAAARRDASTGSATGATAAATVSAVPAEDASTGSVSGVAAAAAAATDDASTGSATEDEVAEPAPAPDTAIEVRPAASAVAVPAGPRPPLPFTRTVFPGVAAASRPSALPEPVPDTWANRLRRPSWPLAISGLLGALALLILALMAVFAVRWAITLPFMQDFLTAYPGEYPLPEGSQPGFPAWLQWQHFFNTFLIVLIIRTGLQVRTDKRPSVFWTPRWSKNGKGKISLSLWFHQSLDVLWLVNGLLFIVLLFATGHWVRIVPTSWEVFPNALSAAIQYVSLDWPTENGWVNYNSLQQLAYFATVFIAAPLAVITGVRMSGFWPKNAKALNKAYPIEWARAVHFPVMLYFVAFIIVHVALVFATGALRNLNHMYAGSDAVNWVGFWIFVGSMVIIGIGWIAARPLVLAPIAALSGKVSGR
ncbi:cytochrome b/b6 domain-containing protein [Microbacterium sp. DT81.1]|uniref:cytochrome b/b6 domain-containing protein n=1 Tax=Microbacterium sp. DT81.1 TaxID=3393413 RepID=UPI003CE89641